MVRRTFWVLVGAGIGAWMVVRAQQAVARLTPSGAAESARRSARHLRSDVAAALDEGRRTKRATEQDLRQAARTRPAIDVAARQAIAPGTAAEDSPPRR